MIEDLKWTSLQGRRKTAWLAMLYRIHNNIIATDGIKNKLQPPPPPPHPHQRQRHSQQFSQQHCRTQYQQYSFLPRTIRDWNDLPQEVIEAKAIDTLCRGPPDCSNPNYLVIFSPFFSLFFFFFFFFFFSHCWPSVKWQNNQHDDCSRFTKRRRNKGPVYKPGCIHWH